jgi:hypothetical protein
MNWNKLFTAIGQACLIVIAIFFLAFIMYFLAHPGLPIP